MASTRGKKGSNRSGTRSRREQKSRDQSCSVSSQEEDYTDCGYSSNETLRLYEKEIKKNPLKSAGTTTLPQMEDKDSAARINALRNLPDVSCTTRNLPDISCTAPRGRPHSHGSDGSRDSRGSHGSRPGSHGSDGDVETDTNSIMTPDQLIEEANSYLQEPLDTHSVGGTHSSRSSLTLTETEMEPDSPFHSTPAMTAGPVFNGLSTMPSSKPPPPPFKIDQSMSARARNRSPIINCDLSRLQEELANGHPAGYDPISPSDMSMIQNGTPNPGRASSSGYETVETSNLSNVSADRTLTRNGGSVSPLGPQLVPYATNEIHSSNSNSNSCEGIDRRRELKPIESPALYEAIQLQSHPSQNSMNSRPSYYSGGSSVETAFMAPSPITHPDQNPGTLRHTGLITNPAILLQQGGRPLPPFNNNQTTIVRQDGDSVNTYSTLNSVNTNSRTATGTFFEYPFGSPTMTNATMQSQGAPPAQQGFVPMYNDKHSDCNPPVKYRRINGKYVCKDRLTWKCSTMILALIVLMLLGILAYLAATNAVSGSCPLRVDGSGSNFTDTAFPSNKAPSPAPTRPTLVLLGSPIQTQVPPGQFVITEMQVDSPQYVQFNMSLPKRSHFALYGSRESTPSHTVYDFVQVYSGDPWSGHVRTRRTPNSAYASTVKEKSKKKTYKDVLRTAHGVNRLGASGVGTGMLSDGMVQIVKRSNEVPQGMLSFVRHLDAGTWYMGMFNDGDQAEDVQLSMDEEVDWAENCPRGCSGHGVCIDGDCVCHPHYTGEDCSQNVCPVLCKGHGHYYRGLCECFVGWKGDECDIPQDQCLVANCNGHGVCHQGECLCYQGFKGSACEEVDCSDPTCSGNGICQRAQCYCKPGFTGDTCNRRVPNPVQPRPTTPSSEVTHLATDGSAPATTADPGRVTPVWGKIPGCSMDCSLHGVYDPSRAICMCDYGWTGKACEQESLECTNDLDCGEHATCVIGLCQCDLNWTGTDCSEPICDLPCSFHGQCVNNSCVCEAGWNGRLCGLEGCPLDCSDNGECQLVNEFWQCSCQTGYQGNDCSVLKETSCSDARDNDRDDLIDCQDPDCCIINRCMSASLCQTVPDPKELLLHLQDDPKPMTLSLYDNVKFLIEAGSVQKGVTMGSIDDIWASVIRGRVVTLDGIPLPGVMVRVSNRPEFGYTTTRPDGMFDMMIEGSGSVQLLFAREPFFRSTKAVYVHRSQFVSVDDVTMISATSDYVEHKEIVECTGDEFPVPIITELSSIGGEGTTCEKTGIIVDEQSVHEQIPVPGTTITLDYLSHLAMGRPARVLIQLVGSSIPLKLEIVHVRITIEGKVYEDLVLPERNLKYSFVWDKTNVYEQPVYGRTTAIVSVGYRYQGCSSLVWSKRPITIEGQQWSNTALGGWQLPIHHSYNYNKASLHMGTGQSIYYTDHAPLIMSIMGDGTRRDSDCNQCEGKAENNRVSAPTALAYTPDGSLFVGDYNFIRKIDPEGNATIIVKLDYNPTYKYYLAANPLDGSLYLSDPQTRQIYRMRSLTGMADMTDNLLLVAGSGEPCLPSDENRCGDGGRAEEAKLLNPKGITISKEGTIYFVDGTVIRKVVRDGTISTFLGSPSVLGPARVPRCLTTMPLDKVTLQYPTDISINPIDDSINVLDEKLVLKLTLDGQASVIAGMPYNCPAFQESEPTIFNATSHGLKKANQEMLESPVAITFSSTGDLFIAETDYLRTHRIRKVTPDGAITWFVGTDSDCDCYLPDCDCYGGDGFSALDAKLHMPIALATSPHNDLYIADQGNLRVRKVSPNIPQVSGGKYEISSPNREQILSFDSKGQHVFTHDALTELNVFTFNYSASSRLELIRDGSSNMFTIERNRAGIPFKMTSSNVEVLRVITDVLGFLIEVAGNNGNLIIQLGYHGNTGLLATRHDGGVLRSVFEYDQFGLLRTAKWPTGHVTKLRTSVNVTHAAVTLSRTGLVDVVTTKMHTAWAMTQVNRQEGEISTVTTYTDGFSSLSYANGLMAEIETRDHPLFEEDVQGVVAKRKVLLPEELVHRLEWRFYARRGGRNKEKILIVGRKLRVNGANVFTLEYNRYTKTERLQNTDNIPILVITHDPNSGLPLEWLPMHGLKPTNATYDIHGRLIRWQRGLFFEAYAYDTKGRMITRHHGSGSWNYHYQQGNKPTTTTIPGGSQYRLEYDAAGHLATVSMPSNVRHFVKTILSLGYTRNCYSTESNSAWLVQDYSHSGQPIQVYYMGTGRKVNYLYDDSDRLSEIIFGQTLVTHKYYEESGQVETIELIDGTFSNTLEYTYNGPLVAHHNVRTRGFEGLVFARFDYTYDGTMRVATIMAEFNATTMPVWEAEYDPPSGRITKISGFTVTYPDVKLQIVSDLQFKLEKQYGDYALLQNIRYTILNVDVVAMDLLYDITQRVAKRTVTILGQAESIRYTYDGAGQLSDAAIEDHVVWHYSYSENGNLITILKGSNLTRLEYDERDRITRVGSVVYQLDADGFLFQRGDESFEYNSFGQVTHAYQPRVYDVRYKYDGLGRPLWRRDHTGRQVQFFYADMTKSSRVTHIFDHDTQELWTLEYDLQGFLFSIKQNQRQIYISTDQSGSPIAVFSDAGRLLKLIQYDPMGNVISDSDPNFVLYIGFHGGLYDPFTRLVHINGRDYDPYCGRWTSPSVQFYNEITKTSKNTLFNLYTFNGNNPVNKDLEINYLMDVWSWLPLLGYDINGMAPTVGCSGELIPAGLHSSYMHDWRSTYKQHQPSTSVDCQARTNLQTLYSNFHTFPLPHLSSDVTTEQYEDTGFTRLPPPTGSGVLPTLENGKVVPVILGDPDEASYKLAEVLQDAVLLERLRNTENGRDVRFFVKLGDDAAQQDLATLGIELDESTVEVELSSAVTVVGQREPGDEATLMLRINTDTTIWDVYYGLTVEEAMSMVLEDAKEIAVQQAWEKEKQAIITGRRGSRNWTTAQRAEILDNGRVSGFEGQYTLDPTKFPEIAFDGNSIRL